MNDAKSFGAALRRERERRGVPLETIAERTKVGVSLLDALERGDLSRWPGGIFRRSFVRGYAEVVGLDATAVLETFLRVCPENGDGAPPAYVLKIPFRGRGPLRLTLAEEIRAQHFYAITKRRLAAAGIDLALIALPAILAALLFGAPAAWPVLGIVSLLCIVGGGLLAGATPGMLLVARLERTAAAPQLEADETVASTDAAAEERPDDNVVELGSDDMRRPIPGLSFGLGRRDRRQTARIERFPRRPSDTHAARH